MLKIILIGVTKNTIILSKKLMVLYYVNLIREMKLYKSESILLHDAPVAPIYQKGEAHLTNPQVRGLQYHKVGPDTTLKHVYIDKTIDRETGKKEK